MPHSGHLQRQLGLSALVLCGVGTIIGAGIYVLIGAVAGIAGKASWLAFLVASILAGCTGLSYAELSSHFPNDSAEAHYARAAFGKPIGMLVGLLMIITGIVGSAAVSLGFGGYLSSITSLTTLESAFMLLSIVCLTALWGIRQSARIAIVLTVIQVLGLLFVIAVGLPQLDTSQFTDLSWRVWPGVMSGAALIFFAYLGFEKMAALSEETKNPRHNIPRGILLSIAITTVLYILVAVSAISVLGADALGRSAAPLADVASKAAGPYTSLTIAIFALAATSSTVLMIFIATSRLIYGMASDTHDLPRLLGWIHPKLSTPAPAILLSAILACPFLLVGKITLVAELTDFTIFIVFILINLAAIVLRYRAPLKTEGYIFRMPFNIKRFPIPALVGAIFCIALAFFLEHTALVAGTFLVIIGAALSYWRYYHHHQK